MRYCFGQTHFLTCRCSSSWICSSQASLLLLCSTHRHWSYITQNERTPEVLLINSHKNLTRFSTNEKNIENVNHHLVSRNLLPYKSHIVLYCINHSLTAMALLFYNTKVSQLSEGQHHPLRVWCCQRVITFTSSSCLRPVASLCSDFTPKCLLTEKQELRITWPRSSQIAESNVQESNSPTLDSKFNAFQLCYHHYYTLDYTTRFTHHCSAFCQTYSP